MSALKKTAMFLGDVFILYGSLALTLLFRYEGVGFGPRLHTHIFPFSLIFIIWLFIFYLADLYRHETLGRPVILLNSLFVAVSISMVLSIIIFYLFGQFFELTPKTNLFIFGSLFFLLDYLFRFLLSNLFTSGALGVVILGNSPLVEEVLRHLKHNPQTGYRIVEQFKEVSGTQIERASEIIKSKKAQIVVAIQPHLTKEMTTMITQNLLPLGIAVINFWDFYESIFEKVPLEELEEGWFIENITTRRPFYDFIKRLIDFVLSFLLFISLLPLTFLFTIFVKFTSQGAAIFKQKRVGKNGKIFTTYKFRTMVDGENGPLWTEKKDSRITHLGKFLRFTHLDEIPQLINILKGDISFTGPRPERSELAEQYKNLPYYGMRHIVKPGLTGWAQINFRPSASIEEAKEKLKYDIYYIKNRSFVLDILIILKTIKYIFLSH